VTTRSGAVTFGDLVGRIYVLRVALLTTKPHQHQQHDPQKQVGNGAQERRIGVVIHFPAIALFLALELLSLPQLHLRRSPWRKWMLLAVILASAAVVPTLVWLLEYGR
jgi:hypothetical protein